MSDTTGVTLLVAMTPDGVIGRDGDMPWRLSGDLRRFKRLTMGGVLIMGRRTYDSIGRPLPGRQTVVVTRQPDWSPDGGQVADRQVHRAADPRQAIDVARSVGGQGIYVVGGAEIYRQLIDHCDWLGLTTVWAAVAGDTRLDLDLSPFLPVERARFSATMKDDFPTQFVRYRRREGRLSS